ncbi:MAG: hypothetical protein QXF95_03095 [Candidatus Caldarchaeum sp.]
MDYRRWRPDKSYGYRWMAESTFSSIKRTFGEYVTSRKWSGRHTYTTDSQKCHHPQNHESI